MSNPTDLGNLVVNPSPLTGKTATQSSTAYGAVASNAISGVAAHDQVQTHSRCQDTGAVANNWWQVDLGAVYDVFNIVIAHRIDSNCKYRIVTGAANCDVISASAELP